MEDSQLFFSIVVPVYNVEAYIEECLNSVLNQTFKDFELIIVNDGSSDGSMRIAEGLTKDDNRVRIINQPNAGLSAARNAGINYAQAKYIYFMDSDDIVAANMLEDLHAIILTEAMPDIIAFNAKSFMDGPSGRADARIRSYDRYYARPYLQTGALSSHEYYLAMQQKNNFVSSACMYVTKTDLIRSCKLKFMVGIIHEDELFSRQLLLEARRLYFQQANYYYRRLRPDSITQSKISKHRIASVIKVADEILALYRKKGIGLLKSDAYKFYGQALGLIESFSGESQQEKSKVFYSRFAAKFVHLARYAMLRNRFYRKQVFKNYCFNSYDPPNRPNL